MLLDIIKYIFVISCEIAYCRVNEHSKNNSVGVWTLFFIYFSQNKDFNVVGSTMNFIDEQRVTAGKIKVFY